MDDDASAADLSISKIVIKRSTPTMSNNYTTPTNSHGRRSVPQDCRIPTSCACRPKEATECRGHSGRMLGVSNRLPNGCVDSGGVPLFNRLFNVPVFVLLTFLLASSDFWEENQENSVLISSLS